MSPAKKFYIDLENMTRRLRGRENDVCTSRSLPGFNLGRLVCLFRSKFLFSVYLLIPVLFLISCQDMCKKKYIILAKCFLMNWYEHSISFF